MQFLLSLPSPCRGKEGKRSCRLMFTPLYPQPDTPQARWSSRRALVWLDR